MLSGKDSERQYSADGRPVCSVFVATSLDGYIARPDGSLDWLDAANAVVPEGEDCGFAAFMATVDTIVMGRRTFEQVLTFAEWPYGSTPVVVLSRRGVTPGSDSPDTVSVSAESPRRSRRIYVDGGQTIQGFLAAGLIDDLTITVIPVLLRAGRPLFGALRGDLRLDLESTRAFDFGFV